MFTFPFFGGFCGLRLGRIRFQRILGTFGAGAAPNLCLGVPGCLFGGDLGSVSGGGAGVAEGLRPTGSPGSGSVIGANACLPRRPRPGARVGARLAGTVPVRVGPPPR